MALQQTTAVRYRLCQHFARHQISPKRRTCFGTDKTRSDCEYLRRTFPEPAQVKTKSFINIKIAKFICFSPITLRRTTGSGLALRRNCLGIARLDRLWSNILVQQLGFRRRAATKSAAPRS